MEAINRIREFFQPQPQLTAEEVEARIQQIENQRTLDMMTRQDEDMILAELYIKTVGMKIDNTYKRYCHVIMNEYLEKNKITDPITKSKLMKDVYKKHLFRILTEKQEFQPNVIERINEYNENIEGITYDYTFWPFYTRKVALKNFSNDLSQITTSKPSITGILKSTAILIGSSLATYFTIRALRTPKVTSIIQTILPQPSQQSPSAIVPPSLNTITLPSFQTAGDICTHSLLKIKDGLQNNLYPILVIAKENCIEILWKLCNKVNR